MSSSSKQPVSSKSSIVSLLNNSLPFSIILTLLLVILVREGAVVLCQTLGYGSAANIVGMISMFMVLMIWRLTYGLPVWLTHATGILLLESGFAFLPVSAGAGLLLFALGNHFWGFMITILISTLIPLWGIATLTHFGFSRHEKGQNKDHPKPTDTV